MLRCPSTPSQGKIKGYFIDMENIAKAALDDAESNVDRATELVADAAQLKKSCEDDVNMYRAGFERARSERLLAEKHVHSTMNW